MSQSVKPVRGKTQQEVCDLVNERVSLSGKNQVGVFHLQSWRENGALSLGHYISKHSGYTDADVELTCKVAFLRQVLGVQLSKMHKALNYLDKQDGQQLGTNTDMGTKAKN